MTTQVGRSPRVPCSVLMKNTPLQQVVHFLEALDVPAPVPVPWIKIVSRLQAVKAEERGLESQIQEQNCQGESGGFKMLLAKDETKSPGQDAGRPAADTLDHGFMGEQDVLPVAPVERVGPGIGRKGHQMCMFRGQFNVEPDAPVGGLLPGVCFEGFCSELVDPDDGGERINGRTQIAQGTIAYHCDGVLQ